MTEPLLLHWKAVSRVNPTRAVTLSGKPWAVSAPSDHRRCVLCSVNPTNSAALWNTPLLRYSSILDGLFHERVTICEADSDCRFYAAMLDAVIASKGESTRAPLRTFADWNSPQPGCMEMDLVAHCGDVNRGSYINSLVLTDIASGWTEAAPGPSRTPAISTPIKRRVNPQSCATWLQSPREGTACFCFPSATAHRSR
jgi:hypothetical protein